MKSPRPPGKTTIDPGVLITIARLATLAVEGVSRMGEAPHRMRKIFRRNIDQGVHIEIEDGRVDVDVYVILHEDTDIRDVSRHIQAEISRAISEMVGMDVGGINVHIDDIDYPPVEEEDSASD